MNGPSIGLNVHNVVLIGLVAVLFILALRLLNKTAVANIPVIGSAVKTGATA